MHTEATDTKVMLDSQSPAALQKVEWGPLAAPFVLLLLCLLPINGPTLNIGKLFVGIGMLLFTLPAVFRALVNKVKVPGRAILSIFLIFNMLNILVAVAYHVPLSKWCRFAFGTYIFVAMIFLVAQKANTQTRRYHLWMLLVTFLLFASYADYLNLMQLGLGEVWQDRVAGWHPGPLIAAMILFPTLGYRLVKRKWLLFCFIVNVFLLFLSASRGIYITLALVSLYTFTFIQKQLRYRLLLLCFIMIAVIVFVATPAYQRMDKRFSAAFVGHDSSLWGRLDETRSAIEDAAKTWPTLFFGKGFGAIYKVHYILAGPGGKIPDIPTSSTTGYNTYSPHNDYAARFLYTGLIGLALQILMYYVLVTRIIAAIRRTQGIDQDIYINLRLHGGLLVLIAMLMQGTAGGVFYFFTNNVYMACAVGLALADAGEVLSRKKPPNYQNYQSESNSSGMPVRASNTF